MKVLIIDDEPNLRAGVKVIIPWQDYDFEIIGEGIDGVDGLNKIMTLMPDLVLIDIRMPGLSGLEVIEKARNKGYQGKFIITTGYSDFEYAKKAIHLGVSTYILKPIDEDELLNSIEDIRGQIIEEKEKEEKLEISNEYIEKHTIRKLVLGEVLNLYEQKHYRQMIKEEKQYYIVIAQVEGEEKQLEAILHTFKRSLLEQGRGGIVLKINEQIVLVMEESLDYKLLVKLQERIEQKYSTTIKMAISSCVSDLSKLNQGYVQAKERLQYTFLFPELKIIERPTVQTQEDLRYGDANWLGQELFALVQVNDETKIEEELQTLKCFFRSGCINNEKIFSVCSNTFLNIKQSVADTYSDLKDELPLGEVIIERIYSCKDIDDIIRYMKGELLKILQALKINTPESTMQKIVYYIGNNYQRDLKLEYLATLFNYNSAYLGKSFKNYTGKSFNVYLDQLRINKAKELLLKGDMRVYEIAQIVGYKHMDYFYSKFKKYVGISPLEYKKRGEG